MNKYTVFDKEDVYTNEIEQKVIELKQLCNRERLPFFIAICTKNDEHGTEYKKEMLSAVTQEVRLKEDLIPKFVNVTLGFDIVQPVAAVEIEYD